MSDDARNGIAATVVVAEDLREKAPDGRYRVKHSIPILDAMRVENIQDVGFGQNIRKGKSLVPNQRATPPGAS